MENELFYMKGQNSTIPNAVWLSVKNIKDSGVNYHEDTMEKLFEGWIKNYFITFVQNNLIVMNNANYRSR